MSLMDPNRVNAARPKRIAIVISNPATSTSTGWPVGFWWSEFDSVLISCSLREATRSKSSRKTEAAAKRMR